jgi:hypothetical protein
MISSSNRLSQCRLSMTEALLEGAQLWLDTPTDPRQALLSDNSNTIIQEWEERFAALATRLQTQIDTALQTALAPMQPAFPVRPTGAQSASADMPYGDGSTTVLQESAPAMKQCRNGHAPYPASPATCPACGRERSRRYRQRQAQGS